MDPAYAVPIQGPDMSTQAMPPLSVLVVEDRDDIADSTAELLAFYGYAVRVARCGTDALAQIAAAPPDVVFLDIGLPDLDGWAVARALRARTTGRQPVVVAVTGRVALEDRATSVDAGIDVHIAKPADPQALTALLIRIGRALSEGAARTWGTG